MTDVTLFILIFSGLFFMAVGSLGIIRMPDLFLRTSATTKAATLGVAFCMLAVALYFNELGVTSRAIAIMVFVLLTSPVAAHMIGRAAYFDGVSLWQNTKIDELKGRYDLKNHTLSGKDVKTAKSS